MNRKQLILSLLLFSLLNLFSTGKWAFAPFVWLMPVVGLYIMHRLPTWRGFFLLYLAAYVPMCIAWYGAAAFPMPIYPFFMLINTFVGILPFLIATLLVSRLGASFWTTLVFPLAGTAVEFFMMSGGPLGSFGALAYTQAALLPFTQLTSITGIWGISFIISWFASTVNWAITQHQAQRPFTKGITVYGVVLTAVLVFGGIRLLTTPQPEQTVIVASLTAVHVDMGAMMQLYQSDTEAFRQQTQAQHQAYLAQTVTAVETGAEVILWPELAGLGMTDDVETLVADGQALADANDIYLAMPLFIVDPIGEAQAINKMVIADPTGAIVLDHVKYGGNIVEGSQPGSGVLQVIETPFGKITAVICWDTDYPGIVRQAGEQGVDLLLSPAYVWPEVASIHADMATFRSIENGMALVRQSDDGYSLVSDNFGRVLAKENHIGQEGVMMVTSVPLQPTRTIYPIVGDIFGLVNIIGLLIVIGIVIVKRFSHPQKEIVPKTI